MSFAYLPWYTGDYLRDTRHLTPMKHGIYLLLLAHCWDQQGPVPLDEQEAAGIANCRSADEIEALRYILNRYFVRMDDGWYNKRMQEEIERANAVSNKRAGAAKARWDARKKLKEISDAASHDASALVLQSSCSNSAMVLDHPSPTPNPIPKPENPKGGRDARARATRLPPDWKPSEEEVDFCRKRRPDLDPSLMGELFANYWQTKPGKDGCKLDWRKTWQNWILTQRRDARAHPTIDMDRLMKSLDEDGRGMAQ